MIACPRCFTYVGSLDEFHVCVTPLRAEFTRLEEQVAYLTEMLTAVHEKVVGALPPRISTESDNSIYVAERRRRELSEHDRIESARRNLMGE